MCSKHSEITCPITESKTWLTFSNTIQCPRQLRQRKLGAQQKGRGASLCCRTSLRVTSENQKEWKPTIHKKQKNFSKKQKGFRDGLSYSTPQESEETRGNTITQPRSHPIPKFYIILMGWDRGWVKAFPFVSSLF